MYLHLKQHKNFLNNKILNQKKLQAEVGLLSQSGSLSLLSCIE